MSTPAQNPEREHLHLPTRPPNGSHGSYGSHDFQRPPAFANLTLRENEVAGPPKGNSWPRVPGNFSSTGKLKFMY